MKAMILAAGLGTRLRPLTNTLPKALVPVNGKPILEIILLRLKYSGFSEVIINVHHHYRQIMDFVQSKRNFGMKIVFSHEKERVLDTGGGIKNASWFLKGEEPFLVHNVDVISDIDLKALYAFHQQKTGLATLAVKGKDSPRSLLFDSSMRLCGWENTETSKKRIIPGLNNGPTLAIGFCGIHIIDPEIFEYMEGEAIFSIITTYMEQAGNRAIYGFPVDDHLWIDIGSFEKLEYARSLDPALYLK